VQEREIDSNNIFNHFGKRRKTEEQKPIGIKIATFSKASISERISPVKYPLKSAYFTPALAESSRKIIVEQNNKIRYSTNITLSSLLN
jgi:hypothetical protein